MLPQTNESTSFFSFFDVLEKLGMIIGTISFGLISEILGGMRPSILSLILFFVIGFIWLLFVTKKVK
jgi:UMF1 family MFS transporter